MEPPPSRALLYKNIRRRPYKADAAQPLTAAGEELSSTRHDLSVHELFELCKTRTTSSLTPPYFVIVCAVFFFFRFSTKSLTKKTALERVSVPCCVFLRYETNIKRATYRYALWRWNLIISWDPRTRKTNVSPETWLSWRKFNRAIRATHRNYRSTPWYYYGGP